MVALYSSKENSKVVGTDLPLMFRDPSARNEFPLAENFSATKVAFGKALVESHSGLCIAPAASERDIEIEEVSMSIATLLLASCALSKEILPSNFLNDPLIVELSCATLNSILL